MGEKVRRSLFSRSFASVILPLVPASRWLKCATTGGSALNVACAVVTTLTPRLEDVSLES
jgi:hypothetical protein